MKIKSPLRETTHGPAEAVMLLFDVREYLLITLGALAVFHERLPLLAWRHRRGVEELVSGKRMISKARRHARGIVLPYAAELNHQRRHRRNYSGAAALFAVNALP